MSRSRISVLAAISWLPLLALGTSAQAVTTVYSAASDWAASYPTSTSALAATAATWGTEAQEPKAWSAGATSWNWTNIQASNPGGTQILTTYYSPNTVGNETGGTVKASFTYTVPFQTYQFNPGSTFQQQVGTTFTEQIASGFKPEKNGGADAAAITLPTGITSNGAASGTLQEIGAVKANTSVTAAIGFTTTAYSISNTFNDGDGSVRAFVAGAFYDYATTNANSTSLGGLNVATSAANNALTLNANFGPSYVAWTAPSGAQGNGSAVVSLKVDELSASSDGSPSFFVMSTASGPFTPLFSVLAISGGNTTNTGGGGISDTTGGSNTTTASTLTGGTLTVAEQINWTSGTIPISPGEVLYFVNDPMHVQSSTHGNHSTGDGNNPLALSATVTYTPEPSSFVLLGMAGVGLAFAAWKRRRAA